MAAGRDARLSLAADHGEVVELGGVDVVYKIPAALTGGLFAIVEHPVAARALVPPHTHSREDELSYVVEGTIGARIGDVELTATRGMYVFKPRGVPHAFWNPTDEPARIVEVIWPPAFADFFREVAAAPDEAAADAIAARYGLTFHMELIDEIAARHGVRPIP